MIITIDGPSATGKSTTAKDLARRLGFTHFDTGAMYRAFSYLCLKLHIDLEDPAAVDAALEHFSYHIEDEGGSKRYFVDADEVTEAIRSLEVTALVSKVAAIPSVRERLVSIQQDYGKTHNAVFEGRDLGTVVFPEAEVKIFLTAAPRVRATRRYDELKAKDPELSIDLDELEREIAERDHRDSTRKVSPLKQAEGALLIDTSELTAEEVVDRIAEHVNQISSRL